MIGLLLEEGLDGEAVLSDLGDNARYTTYGDSVLLGHLILELAANQNLLSYLHLFCEVDFAALAPLLPGARWHVFLQSLMQHQPGQATMEVATVHPAS